MREHLDTTTHPTSLPYFQEVIQNLTADNSRVEQRAEPRYACTLCLEIQPLDENHDPVGSSFMAITRDVSNSGVGFVDAQSFPYDFIRIGIPQNDATVVAKVCYNRPVGDEDPMYLIGVQFIS